MIDAPLASIPNLIMLLYTRKGLVVRQIIPAMVPVDEARLKLWILFFDIMVVGCVAGAVAKATPFIHPATVVLVLVRL